MTSFAHSKETDIYLLGSGILSAIQFTRETEQAIISCRAVFVLHDDLMVHDHIRTLCKDVRDLAYVYDGQSCRRQVYEIIADILINESTAQPTVGLITHGHPLFLVSASDIILDRARSRNLTVRVLPSVSSFDTLLCDLQTDYGYGIQIFDATSMLINGWVPNPKIPVLIFQIATTLNDCVERGEPSTRSLAPLIDLIAPLYPTEHECVVLHSASFLLERPAFIRTRLRSVQNNSEIELWQRPTMYVPRRIE